MDYTSSSHHTNVNYLVRPGEGDRPWGGLLGPYSRDHHLDRCPADRSSVEIGGIRHPRVGRVSLNLHMGANGMSPFAQQGLGAGSLIYRKLADFHAPPPHAGPGPAG